MGSERLHFNLGSLRSFPVRSVQHAARCASVLAQRVELVVLPRRNVVGSLPVEKADPDCQLRGIVWTEHSFRRNGPELHASLHRVAPASRRLYGQSAQRVRFSYGKYDQAPNAAFEQYDPQQQNLFRQNPNFYPLGFTTDPSDSSRDLLQHRLLVGASVQGNGYVDEDHAVLSQDERSNPAVLSGYQDQIRIRAQRW